MRYVGFCHGATHKMREVYSKENIELFKDCGCNAIEVSFHLIEEADKLGIILPFIQDFEYKSLHMPCYYNYADNEQTIMVLKQAEDFYLRSGAQLAVVHPDLISDISVFANFPSMNWAIENMDNRKEKYKDVKDMKEFFNDNPDWKMVLDLGHCYANDKSMKLAENMLSEFKNRIKEFHLSGYKNIHDPLYRVKQLEIIEYAKKLDVPIIIESTFSEKDDDESVKKEYNYILENLR